MSLWFSVLGTILSLGLLYMCVYKYKYIYSLPLKPSRQHTMDAYENRSQLFSHCQKKKEALGMFHNEIIKMI